jgi:hypothetical protein
MLELFDGGELKIHFQNTLLIHLLLIRTDFRTLSANPFYHGCQKLMETSIRRTASKNFTAQA